MDYIDKVNEGKIKCKSLHGIEIGIQYIIMLTLTDV
jgi:hypothetical protein